MHQLGDGGTCCAGTCIVDAHLGTTTLADGTTVNTGKCYM